MDGQVRNEAYLEFLREYPRTGPGTRAGDMLRHYWHPVCLSEDLKDLPYGVRMLGEDLVAFRLHDGSPALIARTCPHRCASLEYGQVRTAGLQCSYHGWTFDGRGNCVDMPLEPADSTLKNEVHQLWYPAEDWGGLIWCYMGADKETPPPLPRIDILDRADGEIILSRGDVRAHSYLSFLENVADMGHVYLLHMLVPGTVPDEVAPYCNMTVDAEWRTARHESFETHYGMKSVVVHDTADPQTKFVNTWSIAMPTHFRFGGISAGLPPDFTDDRREGGGLIRIIDDTHFEIFRYTLIRPGNFRATFFPRASETSRGLAEGLSGTLEKKAHDFREFPAWEGRPPAEDFVIQSSQGAIPPYEKEFLGTSDAGVVLMRRIWRKSMDDVARGEPAKQMITDNEGVLHVDTFKGFATPDEIRLGPENMPSSENGAGLIRDENGDLVFA